MSDNVVQHRDLRQLDDDARSASDVSVDEAAHLDPSQVKGPSIAERAMDEVHAVAAAAKEAVAAILDPHSSDRSASRGHDGQ